VTRATLGFISAAYRGSIWDSDSSSRNRPSLMAIPTKVEVTLLVTE
jgi:hypothetical protein